jgi:hypothetical protein
MGDKGSQWTFLGWSYTIVQLSACKTRGHMKTFQRFWFIDPKSLLAVVYHNNYCQSSDFGCCMTGQHPGLRNIGSQAIMRKKMIFCIHKMEVEKPFLCIGQSTSDENWDKINDWNYQIDMLLPKMSRHYVGTRHIFSTNEQQKGCWQP